MVVWYREIHNISTGGEPPDTLLLRTLFRNYRVSENETHGTRLSYMGFKAVKALYDHYRVDLETEVEKKSLLLLDRHMKMMYYVSNSGKYAVFFSKSDAAMLTLYGGDINSFARGNAP